MKHVLCVPPPHRAGLRLPLKSVGFRKLERESEHREREERKRQRQRVRQAKQIQIPHTQADKCFRYLTELKVCTSLPK